MMPNKKDTQAKIAEMLITAMSKAVEVEVTTCIDKDLDNLEQSGTELGFYTHINLMSGKIDREIDLKLIDNPTYGELQRWHIEQVQQRQGSLVENLVDLQTMFNSIDNTP